MARASASRFHRTLEREPQRRPIMFSGTLVALIVGALVVLWLLGAGGSTLENCQRGDINACTELQAEYRDRYR